MRVMIAAFGHTASGMEVGALDAALGLAERGVDVVLAADAEAELPPRAEALSDAVARMPPRPALLRGTRRENALFLAAKSWQAREVARLARRVGADLIHAYSPGLGALAPARTGVVAQAWMSPPGLQARLRVMLPFSRGGPLVLPAYVLREAQAEASDRAGYRRSDLVLAATEGAAAALRSFGIQAAAVPPPIAPPEPVATRAPSPDGLHIGFCGSPLDRPRKGLTHLLTALEMVSARPLTVTLFGRSDPVTDARVTRLRHLGIDVRTPGHVPRESYLRMLEQDIDVLAFTSLYEEWGYAAVEAMVRGVPVMAFAVHPFREVLEPGLGLLAGPPSSAGLATAISAAASGGLPPGDAVRREATRRFGHRAIARQLVGRYEEVLR